MIFTLILIVHVLVCVLLFAVILVQQGKGASMGAAFGTGGSQTVFGGSGAGNFLTKTTWVAAIVFFSTSLLLAYKGSFHRSVVDTLPASTQGAAPTSGAPKEAVKTSPKGAPAPAAKAAAPAAPAGAPATGTPAKAPAAPAPAKAP